jgi:hypothetical protein
MSLKTQIHDGTGTGFKAKVNTEHALLVSTVPNDVPIVGTPNRHRYYSAKLENPTYGSDMVQDGSITPIEYTIESNLEYDIHIMRFEVLISDGALAMSKFGALTALTNGIEVYVTEEGDTTHIMQNATTNGEVITQSGGVEYLLLTNYLSNSDAFIIIYNIGNYIEQGLRIGRASENKMVCTISDDLSGLDDLFIRVFGYKNFPAEEEL